MEFGIIRVYSRDLDMLIKVSNALNIQVKDKVVTENFRSQLKNAWAKWIEKGRPRSKKAGAKHDQKFKVWMNTPQKSSFALILSLTWLAIVSADRRYPLTVSNCVGSQDLVQEYLSPFFGKSASTTT